MTKRKKRYKKGTKIQNTKPLKTTKNQIIPPGKTGIIGKKTKASKIHAVKYKTYFPGYGQANKVKHYQINPKL